MSDRSLGVQIHDDALGTVQFGESASMYEKVHELGI